MSYLWKDLMYCKVHKTLKCLLNAYSVALQSIYHILKCLNGIALDNKISKMHLHANAFLRRNFTFLSQFCSNIWATGVKVIFWIWILPTLYTVVCKKLNQTIRCLNAVSMKPNTWMTYCICRDSVVWNQWTLFYPMRPQELRGCQIREVEKYKKDRNVGWGIFLRASAAGTNQFFFVVKLYLFLCAITLLFKLFLVFYWSKNRRTKT